MKQVFISFCLLLLSISISAQGDSVSVAEMRALFLQGHRMELQRWQLDEMDAIRTADRRSSEGLDRSFLLDTLGTLRRIGRMTLPPSRYLFFESTDTYGLFWEGTRMRRGARDRRLWKRLARRYGICRINDTLSVIPAQWVSGSFTELKSPHAYGSTVVFTKGMYYHFQKGHVDENETNNPQRYYLFLGHNRLNAVVRKQLLPKSAMPSKHGLRPTTVERMVETQETLQQWTVLSQMVDTLCGKKIGEQAGEYALLFYLDGHERMHVTALMPEWQELTQEDVARLEELSAAIEQMPAGLLPSLLTVDGRVFPGHYVRAVYGFLPYRWSFYDYLLFQ